MVMLKGPGLLADDWSFLLPFWGKARPQQDGVVPMHPCVCHCLDVAAVGAVLLERKPGTLSELSAQFGWEEPATRASLLFLLALHDIGKFSRIFQAIVPQAYPQMAFGEAAPALPRAPRHDSAGRYLLEKLLPQDPQSPFADWRPSRLSTLLAPFAGHHGRPVERLDSVIEEQVFGVAGLEAASRFVDLACALFAPPSSLPQPDPAALTRASWRLSGFAVLADWIGSDQSWFPYYDPNEGFTPAAYFEDRLRRAAAALRAAGLSSKTISGASGYQALTGQKHRPSPVQAFAESMPLSDGPNLVLIEDMTGSGKTEAALILAHRLMAKGSGQGLFMALPTMATADALYGRLEGVYRRLFVEGSTPSLVLSHGAARLHPGFVSSVLPIDRTERASEDEGDRETDRSGAACAAWLADSRRKAFLADVGVGTIDQAFLAVLPARYQSLRLQGLAERVLVVDEAHAYDAYMGKELERLLQFQAGLGGSAIVLSATLPKMKRQALIDAFASGCGGVALEIAKVDYPLVTMVAGDRVVEEPLATRADLPRLLNVRRCIDESAALVRIHEALAAGAAVAWVRNSVDDVFDAVARLREQGVDARMFHARFVMGDRLEVEKDVVRRFGKASRDGERGCVLVATQVIEQSLDLDFDLLVSDLAPIDLLLQRAGRLWRHARSPRPIAGPELLVISPDPMDAPDKDWYQRAFPRGAYVYPDHALLWLTARTLFARESWSIPEDVRYLIEAVYGGIEDGAVPTGLEDRHNEAAGRAKAEGGVAGGNLLDFAKGYGNQHAGWDSDVRTPTRVGEETRTLRLARVVGGRLLPWCEAEDDDRDLRKSWALSEVKFRASKVKAVPLPTPLKAAAAAARQSWTRYEDEILLVPLIEDCVGGFQAEVLDSQESLRILIYSRRVGLQFQ